MRSVNPRVLLTSVCRPLGTAHGDGESVGYELLHRQVTRAQGIFSPRATHHTFALDYIATNLDAPAVALHYPSKSELVRELSRGPEIVGISFVLATFHRMKETVALVRAHAPRAKVVLGGYGTVLDDATLLPFCDHVCREEGVAWFRALLGEAPRPMPYDHPLVVSTLRVLSAPAGHTGMIFAGLGCPHGCDFCSTSHYFRRRHIRLLPTGDDVFRVIERYHEIDPRMSFTILDEDFLVARDRAERLRELLLARGRPVSIFAFATVKALSRITPRELLETGIDGVWMGYEGTRSGFAKQQGRAVDELVPELRSHGITVLTSMILGFDYQTPEIVREELRGLLALRPTLAQFLIYGPTPGTPFFERVLAEGRLHRDLGHDSEGYYKECDGFTAMVRHPTLAPAEIEALQRECFERDYRELGPSVVRAIEVWFAGWKRYQGSDSPYLRAKAGRWADDIRQAWPLLRLARKHAPAREAIATLEAEILERLGPPSLGRRAIALAGPALAAWTRFTLAQDRFQHPSVRRNAYRCHPASLRAGELGRLRVRIDRAVRGMVVSLEGQLDSRSAKRLARGIATHLSGTQAPMEIVVAEGTGIGRVQLEILARRLRTVRHRISVVPPESPSPWDLLARWFRCGSAPHDSRAEDAVGAFAPLR